MIPETPRQLTARRGFSVFFKGKTLLSSIDPITQGERVVRAAHKAERTLYFCPSPVYGYGLLDLLNTIGNDSAVLCVEADEMLMRFTLAEMPPELRNHPKLRLVRTQDAEALCRFIKKEWGARAFRRIEILRITGGWQLYPEIYSALAGAVQRDIAIDWGNAITLMSLGRRYALNFIRNLPLLASAPSAGTIQFGDSPVLVLGAGPSLDGFLDALPRGSTDRDGRPFYIICADTALTALKARGIKPDLVVALEAQHWNLRDFIGTGDWNIPVAMDLSSLPATAEQLGGSPFLFTTPWTPLSIFERLKTRDMSPLSLMPLGSVGLSTVALALGISSGPVLLAGLDFSFSMDTFHAKGTPSQLALARKHNRLNGTVSVAAVFRRGVFKTRAKNGAPVFSDPTLQNYRDLFEQEFSRENRIRDISGTGLNLGIEPVSIPAALDMLYHPGTSRTPGASFPPRENKSGGVKGFILEEYAFLLELKAVLTGEKNPQPGELEALLEKTDYLWSHFPEYAGTSGKSPAVNDLSFLKRVRIEIDPFLEAFRMIRETP